MNHNNDLGIKTSLRRKLLGLRTSLPSSYCRKSASLICQQLTDLTEYQQAQTILCYYSIKNEVDLNEWVEHAWQEKKQVVFPRVNIKMKTMSFYLVQSWTDFQLGAYGIMEPIASPANKISAHEIQWVLVPCVAVDKKGYRLGYGGGYYDRLFSQYPDLSRTAVVYSEQIVPTVFPESHDQQMHLIVTPKEQIYIGSMS